MSKPEDPPEGTDPTSPRSHSQSTSQPTIITRNPTPGMNISSSSRVRIPPPPSPLSRIEPAPSQDDIPTLPPPMTHALSASALDQSTHSSPCFIHSHLDRHGSLQDWLSSRSDRPHPSHSPSRSPNVHHGHTPFRSLPTYRVSSPQHHPYIPPPTLQRPAQHSPLPLYTATSSAVTSPTRKESSSGYDSDRSNANSVAGRAMQDGDLIDDEEEAGSLTRQLAETAQGVREMSKELGRTRVRSRIQHVLIVTKARDNRLIMLTRELALYLMQKRPAISSEGANRPGIDGRNGERGMVVYVDVQLRTSKRFDAAGIQRDFPELFLPVTRRRSMSSLNTPSAYSSADSTDLAAKKARDEGQLRYWTSDMCSNSPQLFDFVVTLGGDGTVLFTSWLFQRIVPPVLPFALGSLGFLTNFDFADYKEIMDNVIDDGIRVNLRMRFTCTVYRAVVPEASELGEGEASRRRKAIKKPGGEILMSQVDKGGWEALEGPGSGNHKHSLEGKDKEIMCFSTRPVEQFEVLNDLVVDRGPSPFVSQLELFGDEHHLTTVQADGLTVSTPTGSTAYSLSAGGSLVHPQIPALLITPICPHTLSFRPMLLPDSMELRICVPYNSRSTAWASFDGRGRVELRQGDHIKVSASKFPFPTVCANKASTDWFSSISRTLRWNDREKQKSFVVVEEDREPTTKSKHRHVNQAARSDAAPVLKDAHPEDGKEDDDEDEDEGFDIDDKSGGDATPSPPLSQPLGSTSLPNPPHGFLHSHRSGFDSPDRFAAPYQAPPPLSHRHLVDAFAAAEIEEKEHELGQRDDIRSDPPHSRVNGSHHFIPPERPPSNDSARPATEIKTPRTRPRRSHARSRDGAESRTKAFAFFGKDDTGSDQSDEYSQ